MRTSAAAAKKKIEYRRAAKVLDLISNFKLSGVYRGKIALVPLNYGPSPREGEGFEVVTGKNKIKLRSITFLLVHVFDHFDTAKRVLFSFEHAHTLGYRDSGAFPHPVLMTVYGHKMQ